MDGLGFPTEMSFIASPGPAPLAGYQFNPLNQAISTASAGVGIAVTAGTGNPWAGLGAAALTATVLGYGIPYVAAYGPPTQTTGYGFSATAPDYGIPFGGGFSGFGN